MKTIVTLILILTVSGCATFMHDESVYDMQSKAGRTFSDENISVTFSFPTQYTPSQTVDFSSFQGNRGIGIELQNKSSQPITIDWDKVTMRDYTGASGKPVMHEGVKFIDCARSKVPSSLPPGGLLRDIITPCYAVYFRHSYWVSMLPEPKPGATVNVGLSLPLKIGADEKVYEFDFDGSVKSVKPVK